MDPRNTNRGFLGSLDLAKTQAVALCESHRQQLVDLEISYKNAYSKTLYFLVISKSSQKMWPDFENYLK